MKASATPVMTCIMKATRAALPNTYHQFVSRGTGWVMIGQTALENPRRSSSMARKRFIGPLADAERAAQHLELARLDARLVLEEAARRWSAGDGPVLVVHAAVAGTEEQVSIRPPIDRTPQVRAV